MLTRYHFSAKKTGAFTPKQVRQIGVGLTDATNRDLNSFFKKITNGQSNELSGREKTVLEYFEKLDQLSAFKKYKGQDATGQKRWYKVDDIVDFRLGKFAYRLVPAMSQYDKTMPDMIVYRCSSTLRIKEK